MPEVSEDQITFEKTPTYYRLPSVAPRIKVYFIIILISFLLARFVLVVKQYLQNEDLIALTRPLATGPSMGRCSSLVEKSHVTVEVT